MILSIMVGILGISFGLLGSFPLDGPFLDVSWVVTSLPFLESGNLKLRPQLSLSWLGPTVPTSQVLMTGLNNGSCLLRDLRGWHLGPKNHWLTDFF